jgi:hypothetical protein
MKKPKGEPNPMKAMAAFTEEQDDGSARQFTVFCHKPMLSALLSAMAEGDMTRLEFSGGLFAIESAYVAPARQPGMKRGDATRS